MHIKCIPFCSKKDLPSVSIHVLAHGEVKTENNKWYSVGNDVQIVKVILGKTIKKGYAKSRPAFTCLHKFLIVSICLLTEISAHIEIF